VNSGEWCRPVSRWTGRCGGQPAVRRLGPQELSEQASCPRIGKRVPDRATLVKYYYKQMVNRSNGLKSQTLSLKNEGCGNPALWIALAVTELVPVGLIALFLVLAAGNREILDRMTGK
jgi:hypothetical protein